MKDKKAPKKELTMKRPTFKDFKKEALKNAEVKAEYDTLAPLFDIKKHL
jgi:hypothetical protein